MLQTSDTPTYYHTTLSIPPSRARGEALGGMRMTLVGRQSCRGGFDIRGGARTSVIPHIVQAGEGVFETRSRSWRAVKGDMFVFFPDEPVHYYQSPSKPWRYSWLVIEGPQAIPAMARAGLTPERPFRSGAIDDLVEPLCLELEKAYRFERFSELFPCAMAWRFVETLCPTDGLETSPRPETNLAENAKFLFDHEFNQYVEVEEVARLLGVTRSTLFRHFQACFGVSPKHYLMTVRVEQARRLLRQTSSPVKEVAAVCGFRSAHYFCRVFRDEMGMSPVAWRKRVA